MNNKYNLVFSCDDKYAKFTSVTISSIIYNTDKSKTLKDFTKLNTLLYGDNYKETDEEIHKENYVFNILTSGFSDETIRKMKELEQELNSIFPCEIKVHTLSDDLFKNYNKWFGNYAAYYRLVVSQLFSEDVDRLVYLDSDIAVASDIRELFALDLKEHTLAVVADPMPKCEFYSKTGAESLKISHTYFNSGVMVINMPKWRENNIEFNALDFLNKYEAPLPDQDALNAVSVYNLYLPESWNYMPRETESKKGLTLINPEIVFDETCVNAIQNHEGIQIIHYTGRKPWEVVRSAYIYNKICIDHVAFTTYWWKIAKISKPFYEELAKLREKFDFVRTNFIAKYRQWLVKNNGLLLSLYKAVMNKKISKKVQ